MSQEAARASSASLLKKAYTPYSYVPISGVLPRSYSSGSYPSNFSSLANQQENVAAAAAAALWNKASFSASSSASADPYSQPSSDSPNPMTNRPAMTADTLANTYSQLAASTLQNYIKQLDSQKKVAALGTTASYLTKAGVDLTEFANANLNLSASMRTSLVSQLANAASQGVQVPSSLPRSVNNSAAPASMRRR